MTSGRVLITDDDRDARVLWRAVVEAENLSAVEAEDGREAMEILQRDKNFTVVITDVMMPLVDGYELLKFVRDDDTLKDKPVIVSTSDRTTRTLSGFPVDGKTIFVNKAAGLDNMRRGLAQALGK